MLDGKGVEGGRKVGGTKENASGGEGNAPKTFDVGILLRSVGAREAEGDLAVVKEFSEVMGDEGRPLVGTDDARFENVGKAHLGSNIGGEVGK